MMWIAALQEDLEAFQREERLITQRLAHLQQAIATCQTMIQEAQQEGEENHEDVPYLPSRDLAPRSTRINL